MNQVALENKLTGQTALLPDGQLVKIETVHDDGYATVRRIEGEWVGTIAVCRIDKLQPFNEDVYLHPNQ